MKRGAPIPSLWDDKTSAREEAEAAGFAVSDLQAADWSRFAALVLAPGIPLTHPEPHWSVKRARQAGVEVIGDMELFFRERAQTQASGKVVVITGTNGKSTTTALTAHLLAAAGQRVALGGNIGKAVLDLEPFAPDLTYVIELSSFQIELAPGLSPTPRRCSTSHPTISTAMARCKTTRASNPRSSRILLLAAPR